MGTERDEGGMVELVAPLPAWMAAEAKANRPPPPPPPRDAEKSTGDMTRLHAFQGANPDMSAAEVAAKFGPLLADRPGF